jgi:hypothetical protein
MQASPSETTIHASLRANMEVDNARAIVHALEEVNTFTLPWTQDSVERKEAIILRAEREYHHLLDKLEHGAVSRQFEVEWLGLPKTGISHHIITRLTMAYSLLFSFRLQDTTANFKPC